MVWWNLCLLSLKDDLFLKDNGTEQFFTQNIWQILSFVTYINISYLNWTHFDNMKVIQIKKNIPKKYFFTFEGVPQFIANCLSKINCLYKDRHMLKNGQHPYVIKQPLTLYLLDLPEI